MNTKTLMSGVLIALSVLLTTGTARADTFTFDTSSLPTGQLNINFQFIDGSGIGDSNNTVTISGFSGGTLVGVPTSTGGASGDLSGVVTLTDNDFFNEFVQQFTPSGSMLSLNLLFTSNVDAGGTPDEFTFAILDSSFREVQTTDPLGTNVLLRVDLSSGNPIVQTFALGAPTAIPEPTTMLLLSTGLAGVGAVVRKRCKASRGT